MNRRLILLSIGALFVAPMSLVANHPHKRPSPPAKACKCGPKCRGGKCVRGCKCRCDSRCGDAPHMGPSRKPSHPHQSRGHDQNTRKPAPQPQGIVAKFDKNKDGRLDETERNEARKYFVSRYRNHKK